MNNSRLIQRLAAASAAAVAVGAAMCTLSGCGSDTPSGDNSAQKAASQSTGAPTGQAEARRQQALDLDARIQAYIDAVNQEDLDGIAAAFLADGVVVDVSRRIVGRVAIRAWAENEVLGGSLEVLDIEEHQGGARLLVHWAPAGSQGWPAYYDFDLADDGIAHADLQYAA